MFRKLEYPRAAVQTGRARKLQPVLGSSAGQGSETEDRSLGSSHAVRSAAFSCPVRKSAIFYSPFIKFPSLKHFYFQSLIYQVVHKGADGRPKTCERSIAGGLLHMYILVNSTDISFRCAFAGATRFARSAATTRRTLCYPPLRIEQHLNRHPAARLRIGSA